MARVKQTARKQANTGGKAPRKQVIGSKAARKSSPTIEGVKNHIDTDQELLH